MLKRILLVIVFMFLFSTFDYAANANLLTNPDGELNNQSGWTSFGSAWAFISGKVGARCWVGANTYSKKYQTIDLLSQGYTEAELDSAPQVYVECWVRARYAGFNQRFKLYVSLQDSMSVGLTSYNTGEVSHNTVTWIRYSQTFTGYGAGLRKIRFENWSDDGSRNWGGNYGCFIDGELVLVDRAGNDTPHIMLEGSMSFTEQAAATVISSNAIVKDIDSLNFNNGGLTVDLTSNGDDYDSFSIQNQGIGAGQIGVSGNDISYGGVNFGTYSGGTSGSDSLIISFNSNSGADTAVALINNILYQNRSDAPPTTKTLRIQLSDGDGDTVQFTKTINLTNVNDSPVLTLPADSITVEYGITSTLTFTSSNIKDSDTAHSINNITVTVSDTQLVRVTVVNSGQGYDTFYFNSLFDTCGVDTILITITDSSGAYDTKLLVINLIFHTTNSAPNTPVLISPVDLPSPYTDIDTYGRTLNLKPKLIWYCPIDADSNRLHFKIYCDTDFGNTLLANSENDTTGFTFYNSGNYDSFPTLGVDSTVYGNTICYKPQSDLSDTVYSWTIQAYDNLTYSDSASIRHFKVGGRDWTDSSISASITLIRKPHIDELREEVNYARKFRGLSAFSWTDSEIIAGVTLIRKVYIDELRSTSEQIATASKETIPVWTDTNIVAGVTLIRKIYFDELRQRLSEY